MLVKRRGRVVNSWSGFIRLLPLSSTAIVSGPPGCAPLLSNSRTPGPESRDRMPPAPNRFARRELPMGSGDKTGCFC